MEQLAQILDFILDEESISLQTRHDMISYIRENGVDDLVRDFITGQMARLAAEQDKVVNALAEELRALQNAEEAFERKAEFITDQAVMTLEAQVEGYSAWFNEKVLEINEKEERSEQEEELSLAASIKAGLGD